MTSTPSHPDTPAIASLDLLGDPIALTADLVDVYSESLHEGPLTDLIESALREVAAQVNADLGAETVDVIRRGNTLVARTHRGLGDRVVLAGHSDTVPPAENIPSRREVDPDTGEEILHGLGSVDMKSGLACYLHAFATLAGSAELRRDLTLIVYEGEEVASIHNGLNHMVHDAPEFLAGSLALLGEPTSGHIEAGCQGTIRLRITAHGQRAHSARSWLGDNALHRLARVIVRAADYTPRSVTIDGMEYREGLNAVVAESGVATNTIPDEAWAYVNFRFAPDRSVEDAIAHACEVLACGTPDNPAEGLSVHLDDAAPGALPGLDQPAAAALIDAVTASGGVVRAKFGWTDVARFSELQIPAVNFGPGDPAQAHTKGEHCRVAEISAVAAQLHSFLTTDPSAAQRG